MRRFAGRRTLAVTALLAVAYVVFALVHSVAVNTDAGRHDQGTYLWCARVLHETHFDAPTNRSQMPAYLYVQALLYPSNVSDADLFAHAKNVSIALSFLLIASLCIFFTRTLPKLEARVAMLVTAFTLFVFRASYVQAELLFYTVSFFGFVALCRLWTRPSLGIALVAGLLEALAFLCKGSVQPGLALFAVLFLVRAVYDAARVGAPPVAMRGLAARVAEISVLCVSFLAPLAPYLAKSREMYGSYFFNVNTRYVMWCDSWDDFLANEARLGKWWTWGPLPVDQLPSMAKYLRAHSLGTIVAREVLGVLEVLGNLVLGTGYLEFLELYLVFAVLAFGFARAFAFTSSARPALRRRVHHPLRAPLPRRLRLLRAHRSRSPVRSHALPAGALHLAQSGLRAGAERHRRIANALLAPVQRGRAGPRRAPRRLRPADDDRANLRRRLRLFIPVVDGRARRARGEIGFGPPVPLRAPWGFLAGASHHVEERGQDQ